MSFKQKNFVNVLNKYQYSFHTGDIIAGQIFSHEKTGYLVDIGNQTAGYLPKEEISLNHIQDTELKTYEIREFFILAYNIDSNQLVLSIKRLTYIRAWERLKQLKHENISIKAYAKGINKGGVLVEVEEIQGFIPNSHLCYNQSRQRLLHKYILCKLLVANEHNNKLILSNRCAVVEKIMETIKIGSTIEAKVIEITDFGIFFNIYDIPSLLHRSEIQEKYLVNIKDEFAKGTIWPVKIIHLDPGQGRISVSISNSSQ
uniref:Ribosomal protein S1 n=1 Tax=Helminthocladia australis TaxID=260093 RepID=A0A1G4NTN7_9FLOR|nr:Ribosomal protein S1 [Helminthocladia australis]SCW22053.1 Ribosomal protein S1 [Helminthocladia australis]